MRVIMMTIMVIFFASFMHGCDALAAPTTVPYLSALHCGYRAGRPKHRLQAANTKEEGVPSLPDFTGEWTLDLPASERMKPMLKACGMNSVVIALVERLSVRQEITASGCGEDYRLDVLVKTRLKSNPFSLTLHGSDLVPGPVGGLTRATSAWDTDVLVTTQFVSADDDEKTAGLPDAASPGTLLFLTKRSLHDNGALLYEDCTVQRVGAVSRHNENTAETLATCRRVLRRD